jgi:tetratricopeptide (TPR) repeat protein
VEAQPDLETAKRDPRLLAAASALFENRIPEAEARLRAYLKERPADVAAIRMLAEVAARIGRYGDAETLLTRCLELAPGFAVARYHYAIVLHRQMKGIEALREVERLLTAEPQNPAYRNLKATILGSIGEYGASLELYAGVLEEFPKQPKVWMSYGHALKTAGQEAQSIEAYRRSSALSPGLGEVWWSLANLKTFRFTPDEINTLRTQLARRDLSSEDRFHFHFALGKALEDLGEFADSFHHYDAGNRLRREQLHYDPNVFSQYVERARTLFTREFFTARKGFGSAAPDPIFIVGLPRSGSTLLEQILASHSAVEGTMELSDVISLARELKGLEGIAALDARECQALGERYLEQTRVQRKTAAPFFIDKMPNNFTHIGFIQLILPNAKIIDARRHPLACCLSGFKQHFARGQAFSYGLTDIGRYYRDYVDLMQHFDAVLPGRMHRVFYEDLIVDTESEIQRLLAYCGLPFEAQCLRFHENARAVRTASSQQVRQPLYREGIDQWRHFEAWLDPLKGILGSTLEAYENRRGGPIHDT